MPLDDAILLMCFHSGIPVSNARPLGRNEFLVISKQGKSKGYEVLNSGAVRSVLVGGRRLVFIQSWYDYLGRLLEEQSTFTPGRHPIRWPQQANAARAAAETRPSPRRRGRPPKLHPPAGDESAVAATMAAAGNDD